MSTTDFGKWEQWEFDDGGCIEVRFIVTERFGTGYEDCEIRERKGHGEMRSPGSEALPFTFDWKHNSQYGYERYELRGGIDEVMDTEFFRMTLEDAIG